ncbi:MAG: PLP-dependent aminotransferase family protein, partial [Bacteroidota bacterium]
MHDFLYVNLAQRFEKMIEDNVLKVGDKLPSVRSLSREQGVSHSTAFQVYVELEKRGLIEARPKSGYYVRFVPSANHRLPNRIIPSANIQNSRTASIIRTVYGNISDTSLTRFCINAPGPELLPVSRIKRSVLHVMRESPDVGLQYGSVQGDAALRTQIARMAFSQGSLVHADDILITAGCMEAINIALRSVCQPGDGVAIESPTYFGIFQAIESLGMRAVEIPTDPETGIDQQALGNLIDAGTISACLLVSNFSNPLGACIPDEKKKELVEMLADKGVPLIENDIYGEMYFGKKRPRSCQSFDQTGNVILCSSVSKTLAPGYRIGWIIPGKYYEQAF